MLSAVVCVGVGFIPTLKRQACSLMLCKLETFYSGS